MNNKQRKYYTVAELLDAALIRAWEDSRYLKALRQDLPRSPEKLDMIVL